MVISYGSANGMGMQYDFQQSGVFVRIFSVIYICILCFAGTVQKHLSPVWQFVFLFLRRAQYAALFCAVFAFHIC